MKFVQRAGCYLNRSPDDRFEVKKANLELVQSFAAGNGTNAVVSINRVPNESCHTVQASNNDASFGSFVSLNGMQD